MSVLTHILFSVIIFPEAVNLEWVKNIYKRKELITMKKFLLSIMLACAVTGLLAQSNAFSVTPEVQTQVIQPGTPLKIKFSWTCPAAFAPKAWRLIAYVPNIPGDFALVTGNKVIPHKMKEWSSVFIMNWNWRIPANSVLVKNTAKWPAGDYKMALYILFQGKGKDGKLQTRMISKNILFSLKK